METIINQISGSKVNLADELASIAWNRRHRTFIEDYGCMNCPYFQEHCYGKTGNEGFECGLNVENSQVYKLFVIDNYADLCMVEQCPSLKDWESTINKETRFANLYATRNLKCGVWMPRTEMMNKFIDTYGSTLSNSKEHVYCEFSILQLHKRIRELLLYKPVGDTASNSIGKQLIDLLIPVDYQYLFEFEGNKNG